MSDSQSITPPIPSMGKPYKFFDFLNAVPNPDGSLTRLNDMPTLPATPNILDPDNSTGITSLSKDIPLDPAANTFIRLFRPLNHPPTAKLPLVIYFHGGGFVFLSATSSLYHDSCSRMATHTPALVASVEYRLAPEHRLPAAYDDAFDALLWARGGGDPWIKEFADSSRVFLMGSSAGANMVYHVGLRALDLNLEPIKVAGLILNQPFFGGMRRTGSELKYVDDRILSLHAADLLWSLALPEGADRGHEYCDPFAGGGPPGEIIKRLPPIVVRGNTGDPLVDKQKEFAEMLAARGANVIPQFINGGHHAVELLDPKFALPFYDDIKAFVLSACVGDQNG